MKTNVIIAAAVFLIVIGASIAAYSYTRLRNQDVLFDQSSILLDSHSYLGFEMPVDLGGKLESKVTGGVGSVGGGVEFYLVNETSWNSWSTNAALRSVFSTVHLNATAVSSQSIEGQFSFKPSVSTVYSVVFVNDGYPGANNSSVHATIILQYVSFDYLVFVAAGLVVAAVGFILLVWRYARAARRKINK